ncbi:MAG: hypothetical protein KDA78_01815 [Planctomycetaceae bacterium]|nr:hypothetical protein [Planctomycetaceae bacterium]
MNDTPPDDEWDEFLSDSADDDEDTLFESDTTLAGEDLQRRKLAPPEKTPLQTGIKVSEVREDLISAPRGNDMHRLSGGLLLIVMMATMLFVGIYVIMMLIRNFSGYLQEPLP